MSPVTSPAAAVSNHFHSISGSVKSPINFMTEVFLTEGGDVKPSERSCSCGFILSYRVFPLPRVPLGKDETKLSKPDHQFL